MTSSDLPERASEGSCFDRELKAKEAATGLETIAAAFALPAAARRIAPLGHGNVNDTYLVTCADGQHYVLQRLNTAVFKQPEKVMANIALLGEHVATRAWPQGHQPRRWEVPTLLGCRDPGADGRHRHWLKRPDGAWRMLSYVGDSISYDTVQGPAHAAEVGRALGGFHRLIHDLPSAALHDTLEGFHITPRYLEAYDRISSQSGVPVCSTRRACEAFVEARRLRVPVLERARASGKLPLRPIHGDPKVNNILLDRCSGQAIALIDLDTVKPGLVHYDIGDCLRSGCNPAGEEADDLDAVSFSMELCRPMLAGYLELARPFLTPAELDHIGDAVWLISFELGLRFFSDYLNGNRYFKCRDPQQNLQRAQVQFRLTESIEAQQQAIARLVQELR